MIRCHAHVVSKQLVGTYNELYKLVFNSHVIGFCLYVELSLNEGLQRTLRRTQTIGMTVSISWFGFDEYRSFFQPILGWWIIFATLWSFWTVLGFLFSSLDKLGVYLISMHCLQARGFSLFRFGLSLWFLGFVWCILDAPWLLYKCDRKSYISVTPLYKSNSVIVCLASHGMSYIW